jgi:hypothetical protein
MTAPSRLLDSVFVAPGSVEVSPAALKYAREFSDAAIGRSGDHVVAFDWAQSVVVRPGPGKPSENIGDCLMLAAYNASDVPRGFVHKTDGTEFAIRIPREVLQASARRLIDIDEKLLFKLALL